MAFNFNWSPLIADTVGAREMLTSALNKSPKPPIIVDDIVVTELNLGTRPPDLEILEIGDLAEDRFRGIFKMTYAGDAFLTLKTRVQANPLNTYLSTRPSFASPETLAAASGLTIPLQITLSDIRLSGFVILVFSRSKGLTLVFRNDPLESLKVSSTFDSIPFVRDYLQKEIEAQLRVLFMEDLPAILHKLSLRLWSPEYYDLQKQNPLLTGEGEGDGVAPIDPLASPPQDPQADDEFPHIPDVQLHHHVMDGDYNFSQKNLSILSNLSDRNTLSFFEPGFKDLLFRAGFGYESRGDGHGSGRSTPIMPSLLRAGTSRSSAASVDSFGSSTVDSETASFTHSRAGSSSSHPTTFSSASGQSYTQTHSLSSRHSSSTGRPRKRKHRVIDLRKSSSMPTSPTMESDFGRVSTTPEPSVAPSSAPSIHGLESIAEEPGAQIFSAPASVMDAVLKDATVKASVEAIPPPAYTPGESSSNFTDKKKARQKQALNIHLPTSSLHIKSISPPSTTASVQGALPLLRSLSADRLSHGTAAATHPSRSQSPVSATGGILEQAWMMKMAREIARRVEEERRSKEVEQVRAKANGESLGPGSTGLGFGIEEEQDAPPAYGS